MFRIAVNGLSPLVAFYFYYEIGELLAGLDEELVRNTRGDADDIAGRQLLMDAALDGAAALFVRSGGFPIHLGATNGKSRRAELHYEDVGFSFVPLHQAIGFAVREQKIFVGEGGELLEGGVVRVRGGFRRQDFSIGGERGRSPDLETFGSGSLWSSDGERQKQQGEKAKRFEHWSSDSILAISNWDI